MSIILPLVAASVVAGINIFISYKKYRAAQADLEWEKRKANPFADYVPSDLDVERGSPLYNFLAFHPAKKPDSEETVIVTEDAEFEIIDPKQIEYAAEKTPDGKTV